MQRKIAYTMLAIGILAATAALLNVAPWHMVLVVTLFLLCTALYFLPGVIASRRHAASATGIVLLNVLLGWTLIGWVAALIWAVSGESALEAYAKRDALNRLIAGAYPTTAAAPPPPRA